MMFEVHKMNQTALAEHFHCGRTQIANIIKNKESIKLLYESNASGSKVHPSKVSRVSEFEEVNIALYKWYTHACSKKKYPGGPELIEKAKQHNVLEDQISKVLMGGWGNGKRDTILSDFYLWRIRRCARIHCRLAEREASRNSCCL